jgi:ABC-type transporter Mla subunit MlaD
MSNETAGTVETTVAAVAPKPTAIQLIQAELANFFKQAEAAAKQAEQAVANVHAVQGAIQATQHLLAKLKAEAEKAEAEGKKLLDEAEAEVKKGIAIVEEKL